MPIQSGITILGIFAADTSYHAKRMPAVAETLIGSDFALGPGGKGSNQAVAAACAGADVTFISKIGQDTFGDMAMALYAEKGVKTEITRMADKPTGAAFIFVNEDTGDNAIIVYPGAAGTIDVSDVEKARGAIESSAVFVTQLEQPQEAAFVGLEIAKAANVTTVFNPSPAAAYSDKFYAQCDYIIPNEIEAADIVGFEIVTPEDAGRAGDILMSKGAGTAVITMGSRGVVLCQNGQAHHVEAKAAGKVVDTTGAGDAFLGGFAAALSNDAEPFEAVRFGSATAGIAVTRRGTAPAMPTHDEVLDFLKSF